MKNFKKFFLFCTLVSGTATASGLLETADELRSLSLCSTIAWQAHGEVNGFSRDSNQKAAEALLSQRWSKKAQVLGAYLEGESSSYKSYAQDSSTYSTAYVAGYLNALSNNNLNKVKWLLTELENCKSKHGAG
ncbi:hypothetical protein [Vibrio lentus]|uniref:Lipoprotein n=1 Tax=Vibrio lentus TaxID=136468 RepID=A0AA44VRH4_9VIBR|nr:hypothetical protein [Vibrio lentus]MCB5358486.1 hypothetical protein [Vibrio lentus]MCB5448954.1 hypothetical protein [Vibrio lentus]MCB5460841.1 hypothetical protein [Vibrio lentus]MCC4795217.1 hypothetical protein [Vibrio lentus]MCC4853272.1 hypothetical protein [Vibrio lentus]